LALLLAVVAAAPAIAGGGGGVGPGGGGGGGLVPKHLVVALYGSPQLGSTILGRKGVQGAQRKLKKQAAAYRKPSDRKVLRAFDLNAVIPSAKPGPTGLYRVKQSPAVIQRYLAAAREIHARLALDIAPGRSSFLTMVKKMRRWLLEPDVDISLDPEWNVGPHGVPGRTRGSVNAAQLNKVSSYLAHFLKVHGLPAKLLVVHQFSGRMIRHRANIRRPKHVDVTLNFDGIGHRRAKKRGYRGLSQPGLFNGFSLFYRLDHGLISPRGVVGLNPSPDFVLYQ
jgi:hypothetical protein